MNQPLHIAGVLLAIATTSLAHGHGTPIHVQVADNRLVVSQGLSDTLGFAPMIYVEDDEDGDPFGELTLPSFGPVVVWQIPGFDIFGMDNDSSLSIEVLLRPVADSSPEEERTFWYWNDQTQLVEPASATSALHLLARANQSRTLTPADFAAPPPLLLSDPMTGQQGFHNHGLLLYALDNDPAPPSGAYGFFARLTSNTYAPSDPFLVVLNRNVTDYGQMIPAALAINAAAVDAVPIPGDYDASGHVDADDYAVWRAHFGQAVAPHALADGNGDGLIDAADYTVWRDRVNAGVSVTTTTTTSSIPEPAGFVMAVMGSMVCVAGRRRKKSVRVTFLRRRFRGNLCHAVRA